MDSTFPQKLISDLELGLTKNKPIQVIGTQSSVSLGGVLSSDEFLSQSQSPHLVVVPNDSAALELEEALSFFSPGLAVHRLEGFDVSPYSGLYPNYLSISKRLHWLYRAQYSMGNEIFIAPISALLQRTLPSEILDRNTQTLKPNDQLSASFYKKLSEIGYQNSPRVEDVGQFSIKGGIVDIFSPAHEHPIRIELFGDYIETLRFFNLETQRTLDLTHELVILPCREVIYEEATLERVLKKLNIIYTEKSFSKEFKEQIYNDLTQKRFFHGIDYLLPHFYDNLSLPVDYFTKSPNIYILDSLEIIRQYDLFYEDLKKESALETESTILPDVSSLFAFISSDYFETEFKKCISLSSVEFHDPSKEDSYYKIYYRTQPPILKPLLGSERIDDVCAKVSELLLKPNQVLIITTRTHSQAERLRVILEKKEIPCSCHLEDKAAALSFQHLIANVVHIIPRPLPESIIFPFENVSFFREEDFFGSKNVRAKKSSGASAYSKSVVLSDLKIGDLVVHTDFGVGVYEGLKVMTINGLDSEFVQLKYQGEDKLYLPVYRINLIRKFSGVGNVDKLGTNRWEKTKIKVRSHLKDIASELLQLYAKRSQANRTPYSEPDLDYKAFEAQFAYDETPDQLSAIESILEDFQKSSPMDRLICGDVGFGKTEIAMRAAFKCAQERRQVCVLVPTTILSFQHLESFKKRFKSWPLKIEMLSRFTHKPNVKTILEGLKTGEVDIVIGTHRLLSKDIQFKNLGLLIVDEEHKFGVVHKEKIKKIKATVDTIALSATPIPRTLNMSLVGIRDLSLINTPPQDRLPIRTFICKFDDAIIKKAIESEIQRGGQVYFLHNRVQNIQEFTHQIQSIVPNVRIRFAHGQMDEDELEKTMLAFFKHEFDVLVSTTIIESGVDIPSANTMIIDRADTMGLSQLYQLRGRVGRSKERAYCYLMVPPTGALDPTAQERLKVLQENSALGSGLRVAHHDLELRGAGNILGDEQSGHANAVGYELYIELLDQILKEARGEDISKEILEPEINLRLPALIPDEYMPDIRVRIAYYSALSKIESPDDMDRFEQELEDQFGKVPEPVMNLMGVMLLKRCCKDLAIRDLSAGTKSLSLAFAEFTPLKTQNIIELVTGNSKKYSLTPDSRLLINMKDFSWPAIYSELTLLKDSI